MTIAKPIRDKKTVFLSNYIFNPITVLLPSDFDEIILGLNIWPKGMMEPQKRQLMMRDEFTINGTTIIRGEPLLAFKYAHKPDSWIIVNEEEYE